MNADLTTKYLGLTLRTPLVPSASPLSANIDNIRRMEDAGAAAVVLHSLFEEQLGMDRFESHHNLASGTDSYYEALSYFPRASEYRRGPEEYLEHIRRAKEAVAIPIIGSLNGTTEGGWTDYALKIQEAGADALELNLFYIPADMSVSAERVEENYAAIVEAVTQIVSIPVAVKLGPFSSNMAHTAGNLERAGAGALVLFNRFYQPDIDLNTMRVRSNILLSTPEALRLPLHWIGLLYGWIKPDLAATGGVHSGEDAIKLLLVGASVTMLCSVLLSEGIESIITIEAQIRGWLEEHEYASVQQIKGILSQQSNYNPAALERAEYIKTLNSLST